MASLLRENGILPVSLILPTYNGDKYIQKCIDSLLMQEFDDFELIVVDDGSFDRTDEILRQYQLGDHRVKVIRQENKGVSEARNAGLRIASGEYVLFVDDDDWFESSMLELMYNKAKADGADVCVCDGCLYDMRYNETIPGKSYLVKRYLPPCCPFTPQDLGAYIFNFSTMHVWNKLFRRSFLLDKHILFEKREYSEDAIFVMIALASARSITVVEKRLFTYRVHEGTSVSDKGAKDILGGYSSLLESKKQLIQRGLFSEEVERSFVNKAFPHLLHFRRMADDWGSFSRWYEGLVTNGGLLELGILGRSGDYFHNEKDYCSLCQLTNSKKPEEYLFNLYLEACGRGDALASGLRKRKAEVDTLKGRLEAIRRSKTFRVGQAALLIPKKIKRSVKGRI